MSRTKFTTLTILAMLMLVAGESSTALAHEFTVNGKAVGTGETIEILGGGGIFLETTVASTAVHIGCGEGLLPKGAKNIIEEKGKFKVAIEFKSCTTTVVSSGVEGDEPKCKVPNFNMEATGELTEAGVASISHSPFATIDIEGVGTETCPLKGDFELKGTQLCDVPDYSVTVPWVDMGCNPLGGKEIKFGTESAKIYLSLGINGARGETFSSN